MLSGSEGSLGPWRETLRCAQGDNRVRVVCWRVVSGRGKFESEWSPVARVARVARVVGVAGIAGELARFAAGWSPVARVVRVVGVVGVVGCDSMV